MIDAIWIRIITSFLVFHSLNDDEISPNRICISYEVFDFSKFDELFGELTLFGDKNFSDESQKKEFKRRLRWSVVL